MRRLHAFVISTAATAAIFLTGCKPSEYSAQADRAGYGTYKYGQQSVLGESGPFDITYQPFGWDANDSIRIGLKVIPIGLGKPVTLTLAEALEIAFSNSREFQTQKEAIYTQALALANARRGWDVPLFSGELDADAEYISIRKGSETKSASAEIGPSLTQRFINGGVLTLAATLDWMTDFVAGSQSNVVGSLLEANFTQPLLRGAWRGLAYEDQYRLERDFLFAVFEYDRYRQTFAVDILSRYYAVVQQRDELENERANIERLEKTFALAKIQVEGGQASKIQQDQAEQDLLNAQTRFERNKQDYSNALDRFKITLGLPITVNIELDYPGALTSLAEIGPKPIIVKEEEAISIALTTRPDVLSELANVRDADRNVEIAVDQFYPQLDIELGISAAGVEPRKFHEIRFDRHQQYAALTFNYNLDQTDNRDNYRLAMIDYQQALRDLDEFLDNVRLDVRQSYRQLVRSQRSYELQKRSATIAQRRSQLASLEYKEGLASARDVLEAEEALRSAQNGRTGALVTYTTTRLQFLATLGLIAVDDKGRIYERKEPLRFERISRRYDYVKVD